MDADWPLRRFEDWMAEAAASEPADPNAMTLATVDGQGQPSARIVLLKGVDARGFVFYSNAESRKGSELAGNPRVALLFHWKTLARQVRVEGEARPVSDAEADAYFASRGRLSQLGAWASEQSRPLDDRATLLERIEMLEARYPGEVPRPPHWRGWRVAPARIEFWRDRPGRLHEREVFVRAADAWEARLLYP